MKSLIDKLELNGFLSKKEWCHLLTHMNKKDAPYLFEKARLVKKKDYKDEIYIRGLI